MCGRVFNKTKYPARPQRISDKYIYLIRPFVVSYPRVFLRVVPYFDEILSSISVEKLYTVYY